MPPFMCDMRESDPQRWQFKGILHTKSDQKKGFYKEESKCAALICLAWHRISTEFENHSSVTGHFLPRPSWNHSWVPWHQVAGGVGARACPWWHTHQGLQDQPPNKSAASACICLWGGRNLMLSGTSVPYICALPLFNHNTAINKPSSHDLTCTLIIKKTACGLHAWFIRSCTVEHLWPSWHWLPFLTRLMWNKI